MKTRSLPLLNSRFYNFLAHLGGWLLFFSLITGFAATVPTSQSVAGVVFTWPFFYFACFFLFLFYLNNYFLFPGLYLRKKVLAYAFCILLLFILLVYLQPFENLVTAGRQAAAHNPLQGTDPGFTRGNPPGPPPPFRQPGGRGMLPRFDIVSIILFIMIWSFSTVLQVVHQWRNTERRAVQAEADRAKTELSFLRAQINPHFLFNTLNNIYSLIIMRNDLAPEAILQLSQIMRYVTDEATRDSVPLEQEVECIRNYISLQRLRLNSSTSVNFKTEGEFAGHQVPPILLMTFVENIFKYGISSHEQSEIRILIATQVNSIHFACSNTVFGSNEQQGRDGVGIKNAVSRLQQLYPGRHEIEYGLKDNQFVVELNIRTTN